ncbi:MAG: sugar phosphate isomerase/epimerase [Oscillospiraceae bacterium]
MNQPKIALQMYSLREYDVEQVEEKLQKVKNAGYDGVEFAGFYDIPVDEMKRILEKCQLLSMGTHTRMEELQNNLEEVIAYNKELGTSYVIIPYFKIETKEDLEQLIQIIKTISPKIKDAGMSLLYHNHYHEFRTEFDNKPVLELLRDATTPEEFNFEIDMFWTTHADQNPLDIMARFGSRCKTVHLKDMTDKVSKEMTEVGTGIVDMQSILTKCKADNFEWVVVEQEKFIMEPYESIAISLQNIRKMLG